MEKKYAQLQKLKTTQGRFQVRKAHLRHSNNLTHNSSHNLNMHYIPSQFTNYIILGILGTLANAFFKLLGKATIKNRANVHANTTQ
jgi:hypothetical protein